MMSASSEQDESGRGGRSWTGERPDGQPLGYDGMSGCAGGTGDICTRGRAGRDGKNPHTE